MGSHLMIEVDPRAAASRMIEHIEQKRKGLGI